jgi:DNA sulfur modification protein DndE
MAKDPVPLAGEKREMPKIETLPVTEATPVFRGFYINNIVCNGAEKAVFVRGIPEMQISNINLNNLVMQTRKGIECTEGNYVNFNNIRLVTTESDPLISLQNSGNIQFNNISYHGSPAVLFGVNGDRTKNIKVSQTDISRPKSKSVFAFGANSSSLEFK